MSDLIPGEAGRPDVSTVRPKLHKSRGDCAATALAYELSCDLPTHGGTDHYDAEYGAWFRAPASPDRHDFTDEGPAGLMQFIPPG